MSKIAIKIKSTGEVLPAEKGKLELKVGDSILIEISQFKEVAEIVNDSFLKEIKKNTEKEQEEVEIIRKLSEKDLILLKELKRNAQELIPECQNKIGRHKLQMELLDADLSFDEKKLTFYFSAKDRVDFRALVSDLASTFKKIIRLQQVGPREEAQMIGGCGRCGQVLCCRRFLRGDLDCSTMEMAKLQGLAIMGQNRCVGSCGKLLCCLSFEMEDYKNKEKNLPKVGESIKTKEGKGVVISQNVLQKKVVVELPTGERVEVEC